MESPQPMPTLPPHRHTGVGDDGPQISYDDLTDKPASASVARSTISTSFEATTRFSITNIGAGTTTFGIYGADLKTSATNGNGTTCTWYPNLDNSHLLDGSPTFSCSITSQASSNASANGSAFFGMGQPTNAGGASSHNFTQGHIGFKVMKAGGVETLYATQGDYVGETALALTTLTPGGADFLELCCVKNGTTSVDYYWQKNGGGWNKQTLTGNLLTTGENQIQVSVCNDNTGFSNEFLVGGMAYSR